MNDLSSRIGSRPASAGARLRAALAEEKPLQVIGAINAYHARMAERVGARHHHKIGIGLGVDRGLDAVHHFLLRDELLPGAVAAALGADLILDMHRGCAELGERLHGTRDVEGARAKPRVHVHQKRQGARVGDAPHVGEDIVEPALRRRGSPTPVGCRRRAPLRG